MASSNHQPTVFGVEDLENLVANVPEKERDAVHYQSYQIMDHEAYINKNYRWCKDDFELGSSLGKGKKSFKLKNV